MLVICSIVFFNYLLFTVLYMQTIGYLQYCICKLFVIYSIVYVSYLLFGVLYR